MTLVSHVGDPAGGEMSYGGMTLVAGYPMQPPAWRGSTRTVPVSGTVGEPVASVTVNGRAAVIAGLTFSGEATLVEGRNVLTVKATDLVGNRATKFLTVTLNTQPPPRPTAGTWLAVTTAASYPLSGTKTAGTSIWINGVERVPLDGALSWAATAADLVEGDNLFSVVARNALGTVSSALTVNLIVDRLPPVLAITSPPKTNLATFPVTGTVDDSLTVVRVNGVVAARSGKTFECVVPLVEGAQMVTITATSPNNYTASTTSTVTRGTIPAMTAVSPSPGTILYVDRAVPLTIEAADKEGDALSYRMLLDGTVLKEWDSRASFSWTPTLAQRGTHRLEAQVRDAFGGLASAQVNLCVLRNPVSPPLVTSD